MRTLNTFHNRKKYLTEIFPVRMHTCCIWQLENKPMNGNSTFQCTASLWRGTVKFRRSACLVYCQLQKLRRSCQALLLVLLCSTPMLDLSCEFHAMCLCTRREQTDAATHKYTACLKSLRMLYTCLRPWVWKSNGRGERGRGKKKGIANRCTQST